MLRSIIFRALFITAFLVSFNTVNAQKSSKNLTVGEKVDDITAFVEKAGESVEDLSNSIINDLESFGNNSNSEFITKVADWSEMSLEEIKDAALEAKLWLKKQHFSSLKKADKKPEENTKE